MKKRAAIITFAVVWLALALFALFDIKNISRCTEETIRSGDIQWDLTGDTWCFLRISGKDLDTRSFSFTVKNSESPLNVSICSYSGSGESLKYKQVSRLSYAYNGRETHTVYPFGTSFKTGLLFSCSAQNVISVTMNDHALQKDVTRTAVYRWTLILLIPLLLLGMSFAIWRMRRMELKYLVCAAVLGTLMLISTTPLSPPDELTHYSWMLGTVTRAAGSDTYDSSLTDFYRDSPHVNSAESLNSALDSLGNSEQSGERHFATQSYWYNPAYYPGLLGMSVARLLSLGSVATLYCCRIFQLAFYVVITALAVKVATKYKLLFFMCGLIPMGLFMGMAVNYDGFILSMSLLLTALLVRAISSEAPVTPASFAGVAAVCLLLAPAKAIYMVVLLLIFFIPRKRLQRPKLFWAACAGVAVLMLLEILLVNSSVLTDAATGSNHGVSGALNWEGKVNYSIADIFSRPIESIKVFVRTARYCGGTYILGALGGLLSGMTLTIGRPIIIAILVLLIVSALISEEKPFGWKFRITSLMAFAISAGMVLLIFFLTYTSNDSAMISGVQGRYFLPLLILPLFVLAGSRARRESGGRLDKPVMLGMCLCDLLVVLDVLMKTL